MKPGSHSASLGKNSTSTKPTTSGMQNKAEPRKIGHGRIAGKGVHFRDYCAQNLGVLRQ